MPEPRKTLVSLEATPYYHCVSRCVRGTVAYGEIVLAGEIDVFSGHSATP